MLNGRWRFLGATRGLWSIPIRDLSPCQCLVLPVLSRRRIRAAPSQDAIGLLATHPEWLEVASPSTHKKRTRYRRSVCIDARGSKHPSAEASWCGPCILGRTGLGRPTQACLRQCSDGPRPGEPSARHCREGRSACRSGTAGSGSGSVPLCSRWRSSPPRCRRCGCARPPQHLTAPVRSSTVRLVALADSRSRQQLTAGAEPLGTQLRTMEH